MERAGQSAGKLAQGGLQLAGIGGVDHAQNRFGLREIDAARQKRPEREFARLGQPRSRCAERFQKRFQKGGEPIV